jgi:hypothetical protein
MQGRARGGQAQADQRGDRVDHPACMDERKTEHDLTQDPLAGAVGSAESLLPTFG